MSAIDWNLWQFASMTYRAHLHNYMHILKHEQVSISAVYDVYGTPINPRLPRAMAVDDNGASYVTGLYSTVFFLRARSFAHRGKGDVWVGKLDPAGQWLWVQTLGGAEAEEGRAIALDGDSVFVAGTFQSQSLAAGAFDLTATSTTEPDVFVARLNATSGDLLWARAFGGNGADSVASLVASSGMLYMAGSFQSSSMQFDAELVANSDSDASSISSSVYFATLSAADGAVAGAEALPGLRTLSRMVRDPRTGAIFLVGQEYVARAGAWYTTLAGSSITDLRRGLTIDPSSGRVFVAAPFNASTIVLGAAGTTLQNAGSGFDSYVASLDATTGEVQWARHIGGSSDDYVVGLAADGSGGVYVAGTFEGQLDGLPVPWDMTALGTSADAFLLRYNDAGGIVGAWRFGSTSTETLNDVATDRFGGVYVVGKTDGITPFGRQNVTQHFIARVISVRVWLEMQLQLRGWDRHLTEATPLTRFTLSLLLS
jgi:outer membrane protein assembly factor BamB